MPSSFHLLWGTGGCTKTNTAVSTKVVPTKRKSVRDNAERLSRKYPINFNKSSESILPAIRSSLYSRGIMDSELLLKFIGYFPDYLSVLSRTLLRFVWTTFFETAVYKNSVK